jgi:hypothetical protein
MNSLFRQSERFGPTEKKHIAYMIQLFNPAHADGLIPQSVDRKRVVASNQTLALVDQIH